MKDVEMKLVAELIKNSRRSDRELARQLHVSQPTVTRIRNKMEKEGIIREYTIVPDFARLGYLLASVSFAKLKEIPSRETFEEVGRQARELEKKNPCPTIVSMQGMGCDADYVSIAFHKTYSEYAQYMTYLKQFPHVKVDEIKSFLIDLSDKGHFRYLTFSVFADYLLREEKQ